MIVTIVARPKFFFFSSLASSSRVRMRERVCVKGREKEKEKDRTKDWNGASEDISRKVSSSRLEKKKKRKEKVEAKRNEERGERKNKKDEEKGEKKEEKERTKRRGDSQAVCKARSNLVIESGLGENLFTFATFLLFLSAREAKKRETWRKMVALRSFRSSAQYISEWDSFSSPLQGKKDKETWGEE